MIDMSTLMLPLVVLAAVQTPTANRQSGRVAEIQVTSCSYADSLLGTDWERGGVTASREADGTVHLSSGTGGIIRTTILMGVLVSYRDSTPPRDPYGLLHMIVFDDRRLAQALTRADTTTLTILLDDTLTLDLGSPIEGEVRGATRNDFLSVNLSLPRSAYLAMARARRGRATIAGRNYPVSRLILKEIARSYRAAVCMNPSAFPPSTPLL